MLNTDQKPTGKVLVPATLCALAGTLLSVGLSIMGYFDGASDFMTKLWSTEPYYLENTEDVAAQVHWGTAFVASWIVALLTLSSAFVCRRFLVGLMLLTVLLTFSPVLMLWGVLWLPMVTWVAALWAWACAVIYGAQHTMPSEHSFLIQQSGDDLEKITMKVETIPFPTKKKVK